MTNGENLAAVRRFRHKPTEVEIRGPLANQEVVETAHGAVFAYPGEYVARNPETGDKWPITAEILEASYDPLLTFMESREILKKERENA
jgi:hypothetical protein